MTLSLKSPPVAEPVTLSEVKIHLNVSPNYTDEDALLSQLIQSARMEAENILQRILVESEWTWEPETPASRIPITPVTRIVSVHDIDDPLKVVDETQYTFKPSSLVPQGNPLYGEFTTSILHCRVNFMAGWGNTATETVVPATTPPPFIPADTQFTSNAITLSFGREIQGTVQPDNITVTKAGVAIPCTTAAVVAGRLQVEFAAGAIAAGDTLTVSYVSGMLKDMFGNYVAEVLNVDLPLADFSFTPLPLTPPDVRVAYTSTVPSSIKNWMLLRIGTLFQQRSEIALRAGQANNALFPRSMANGLLDPYLIVGV